MPTDASAPAATYRLVDRTRDFALEVEAPDMAGVASGVVRGLLALLTDAPASVSTEHELDLDVTGIDEAATLAALGNEVLYLFDAERWLAADVSLTVVEPTRLAGVVRGEPFDPARHPIARPMKAVTHHGAAVVREGHRLRARLVVDL